MSMNRTTSPAATLRAHVITHAVFFSHETRTVPAVDPER